MLLVSVVKYYTYIHAICRESRIQSINQQCPFGKHRGAGLCTIYHHLPIVISGFVTPLYLSTNQWEFWTSMLLLSYSEIIYTIENYILWNIIYNMNNNIISYNIL